MNRTEEALKLGNYLKTHFPVHGMIKKVLARIYIETGNWDAARQEWQACRTLVSEEENLYVQTMIHLQSGAILSARRGFGILLKDHNRPLWGLYSLLLSVYFMDRDAFEDMLEKLGDSFSNYPLVRYLKLEVALREKNRSILSEFLPGFLKENQSEVFQLLSGVNSYLLDEKLKAVQILEKLRNSAREEKTILLSRHLVDSFLEGKNREVENVLTQVDLHAPGVFGD